MVERCCLCGINAPDILQLAHLNQDHTDNRVSNLVCLCPTCHRLYDIDLIPKKWVVEAKSDFRRGVRKFSVSKLWKVIEQNTKSGKRGDWGVLLKQNDSKRTQAGKKARDTKISQGQNLSKIGRKAARTKKQNINNSSKES